MAQNHPAAAAEQYSANCGTGAAEKRKKKIYTLPQSHKRLYTVLVKTPRYLNRNQVFKKHQLDLARGLVFIL